ncbi:unnamed protein product [Pleuronectes platessa]|uniref:Uncharacterized protein n=1 Tax=Pleuronectes platessa TaxID=8262 RepID=A0A9N7YX73_PLEPL|nr:unnamed protein product [Pleuronectes platessa]
MCQDQVQLISIDDSAEAHQGAHLHSSTSCYIYPGCAPSHRQFVLVATVDAVILLTCSSSPLTISQSYQHSVILQLPTSINTHERTTLERTTSVRFARCLLHGLDEGYLSLETEIIYLPAPCREKLFYKVEEWRVEPSLIYVNELMLVLLSIHS